jgi:hypothetical protein
MTSPSYVFKVLKNINIIALYLPSSYSRPCTNFTEISQYLLEKKKLVWNCGIPKKNRSIKMYCVFEFLSACLMTIILEWWW